MTDDPLVRTRDSLHAVAEHVLAGPEHRATTDIRLRVSPGGFQTWTGELTAVVGTDVVHAGRAHPISGRTARELAAAIGVDPGAPVGVYGGGGPLGVDDVLEVDPAAAQVLAAAWAAGDEALRRFAPGVEPTLWPEHFDVAVGDSEVDWGVSPGDGFLEVPYAYVSVGGVAGTDPFWNAPFGVARPVSELGGADAVLAFFGEARTHLPTTDDPGSNRA
ncbi:hypothetical protein ACXR2U_21490 [Jatrophihabitans sp. YIM 134969]